MKCKTPEPTSTDPKSISLYDCVELLNRANPNDQLARILSLGRSRFSTYQKSLDVANVRSEGTVTNSEEEKKIEEELSGVDSLDDVNYHSIDKPSTVNTATTHSPNEFFTPIRSPQTGSLIPLPSPLSPTNNPLLSGPSIRRSESVPVNRRSTDDFLERSLECSGEFFQRTPSRSRALSVQSPRSPMFELDEAVRLQMIEEVQLPWVQKTSELQEQIKDKTRENSQLQQYFENETATRIALQQTVDRQLAEIKQQQEQNAEITAKLGQTTERITKLQQEVDEKITKLTSELEKKKEEEGLELIQLKTVNEDYLNRCSELIKELKQVKESNTALVVERDRTSQSEKLTKEQCAREIRAEREAAHEHVKEIETKFKTVHEQMVEARTKERNQMLETNTKLQAEISKLQNKLQEVIQETRCKALAKMLFRTRCADHFTVWRKLVHNQQNHTLPMLMILIVLVLSLLARLCF
eukprot:c8497_g1_i1.p1 GENE.c8497_g1_i1~~c8497_g1_i1.p1  ORF type:complete len:468 (+),score=95.04 c8497_g1_i1:241-1644(+)